MPDLILSYQTIAKLERLPHVKDRMFKRAGFTRRPDGSFVIPMDDKSYQYIMAHGSNPDGAVSTMLALMHYRD